MICEECKEQTCVIYITDHGKICDKCKDKLDRINRKIAKKKVALWKKFKIDRKVKGE